MLWRASIHSGVSSKLRLSRKTVIRGNLGRSVLSDICDEILVLTLYAIVTFLLFLLFTLVAAWELTRARIIEAEPEKPMYDAVLEGSDFIQRILKNE